MFNDDIFEKWLDKEANKVLEKLNKDGEPLSIEDKMILTLKAQTNHFYHLDLELREEMKKTNSKLDGFIAEQNKKWEEQNKRWDISNQQLTKMYEAINSQTWKMIGAVGFIVILGRLIDTFGK